VAKQDPKDRAARTRLLRVYLDLNRVQDAIRILDAALHENPKDTDALIERGEVALESGNVAEAERYLNAAAQFQPDSVDVHAARARLYGRQGSVRRERQELGEVLRLSPSHLGARVRLTQSYLVGKKGGAALQLLAECPEPQQNVPAIVAQRNWALLMTGRQEEARKAIEVALKTARTPDLLIQDGNIRLALRQFDKAHQDAVEALTMNPQDLRAVRLLADSSIARNQKEQALKDLRAHLSAYPKSAPLQYVFAQYLLLADRRVEGRQAFADAYAIDPRFLPAAISLADLDLTARDLGSARQWLNKALASDPRNVAALLQKARLEELSNDRPAATAAYRAVVDVDSTNLPALNNLAFLLALNSPDEAIRLAQQALELAPTDPVVEDTLGWIWYCKGVFPRAVSYLERATAKNPTPQREFHLGMAYLKSGDSDRGRKLVASALLKDPKLPQTEVGW
jgi:tetratricopeptide (TPR) repeat protein